MTEWLRKYPFAGMLVALATGILLSWVCAAEAGTAWMTAAAAAGGTAAVGLAVAWWVLGGTREVLGMAAVGVFMFTWGLSSMSYSLHRSSLPAGMEDSTACYRVWLLEEPYEKNGAWQTEAEVLWRLDGDSVTEVNRRVLLRVSDSAFACTEGDYLVVRTRLQVPKAADEYSFDYGRYLRLTGIAGTAYTTDYAAVGHRKRHGLMPLMARWRNRLEQRLADIEWHGRKAIAPRERGVLEALVLGDRRHLDTDLRQAFSAAGAMHVLAVSGLHVSVVGGIILWLLTLGHKRRIDYADYKRRYAQCAAAVGALWVFALLTGLSVSVVRSTLMFTLLFFGQIYRPGRLPMNEVSASAVVILLCTPTALLQSGFLLSYSAVLAIVVLTPPMRRLAGIKGSGKHAGFPRLEPYPWLNKPLTYVTNLLIVSLAAQIGTLPWTMWFFGQVSTYFALTNLLVLPLVGVLMPLALLTLLLGGVPWLGSMLAGATQWLTWVLNEAVEGVQAMPGSVAEVGITGAMTAVLVLIAAAILLLKKYPRQVKVMLPLLVAAYAVLYLVDYRRASAERSMHCYDSRGATTVMLQDGRHAILLTTDSVQAMQQTHAYRLGRHIVDAETVALDTTARLVAFQWDGRDYLLARKRSGRYALQPVDDEQNNSAKREKR